MLNYQGVTPLKAPDSYAIEQERTKSASAA